MAVRYATGPVTWGVDFADAPNNPSWQSVLDDIEESGIGALELGPVGYLPEDETTLRDALTSRNLRAVGSFVFDNLHDLSERPRVEDVTRRACNAIRAAGGTVVIFIDQPSGARTASAGRSDVAPRLGEAGRSSMIETLRSLTEIAREHDLHPTVHPHVGGYIEFEDEIEWIADTTELDFTMDTGHLAYGGMTPQKIIDQFSTRTAHMHFKDIRADVYERIQTEGLGFWDAIEAQIFCPLGQGLVDVAKVLQTLDGIGYDGYATIEQDRVPGAGCPPLDDLLASMTLLRRIREF